MRSVETDPFGIKQGFLLGIPGPKRNSELEILRGTIAGPMQMGYWRKLLISPMSGVV